VINVVNPDRVQPKAFSQGDSFSQIRDSLGRNYGSNPVGVFASFEISQDKSFWISLCVISCCRKFRNRKYILRH